MTKKLQEIRSRQGFTLIELLVVLVIIAILATLAVVLLTGQTGNAGDKVANSNLEAAGRIASARFVNDNGLGTAAALATALNAQGSFENVVAADCTTVTDCDTPNTLYVDNGASYDGTAGNVKFLYTADANGSTQKTLTLTGGIK